ncbi:MAG: hypothetical protein AB1Z18_11545 [Desulfobacterales bacterium]
MFRNNFFQRHFLWVVVVLTAVLSTSCASFGSKRLIASHTAYNDAVQLTVSREVLANIVRSRYSDPMQFIAVNAINASFSVSVSGSAGVGGIGQAGTVGEAAGAAGYSDSPTITFIPQSDAAFYKSFFGLFDVEETVLFGLAYRYARTDPGWQELSLRFSFGSINDANDFTYGKMNELYNQRVKALAQLLLLGATYQQVPEWDFDSSAITATKVTGEDRVNAFKHGLYFIEEDNGEKLRLARYRMVLALTLPAADAPEAINALEDLGVEPGRKQYVLRPPLHATPGITDPYAIWVTPRSMADVIGLATRFVDVPTPHLRFVPPLEPITGESSVISAIRIRSSEKPPSFPYRIQHRGYWFYVDDSEIETKMFFEAIVAAYSSRVGSKQAGDEGPQVVLPVGG